MRGLRPRSAWWCGWFTGGRGFGEGSSVLWASGGEMRTQGGGRKAAARPLPMGFCSPGARGALGSARHAPAMAEQAKASSWA